MPLALKKRSGLPGWPASITITGSAGGLRLSAAGGRYTSALRALKCEAVAGISTVLISPASGIDGNVPRLASRCHSFTLIDALPLIWEDDTSLNAATPNSEPSVVYSPYTMSTRTAQLMRDSTAIAQAIARRNPRESTAAHTANAANPMPTAMVSITIHPKLTPKTRKTSDNSHTTSPPTPNPARPTSSSRNSTWIVHRGSPRRVDGRMTASIALNAVSANSVGGNQPLSR